MATDGAELAAEPEDLPSPVRRGRMLGRYVLCYELASGGMATVYLARADGPAGFGKLVALKLIHPHLAKQREFVEMFLDEARIAARIVHPNVCSVFDFGEEDSTYYIAMDYLVGETVGRLTRAVWRQRPVAMRPTTPRIFARIIADACEGLHAAHESRSDTGELLGVVHRDVTPHNLFAGYDGSVRVVDFGVAVSVGRSHHTTAGTLKGKYPYMSPEQVKQEPLDRRSDVWSLGVCLWEMLSGRRLFGKDGEFETLKAVTAGVIPPVSSAGPHVPALFDPILARALSRDKDARYASARELGRDLSQAIGKLGGASAADVAELMDELFKTERAERIALIERARKVDPEQPSTSKVAPAGVRDGLFSSSSPGTASSPGRVPAEAERLAPDLAAPIPLTEPSTAPIPLVTPGALPLTRPRDPTAPFPLTEAGTAPIPLVTPGAVPLSHLRDPTAPIPLVTPGTASEPPARSRRPLALAGISVAAFLAVIGMGLLVWRGVAPAPTADDGAEAPTVSAGPPSAALAEPTPVVEAAEPVVAPTADAGAPAVAAVEVATPDRGSRERAARRAAEREASAAGAASGATGTVNVVTPPGWAEIFVGGRRVGRSPTSITLPAGRSRVRLMPYGEGPAIERSVTVEAGGTARLVVRLDEGH